MGQLALPIESSARRHQAAQRAVVRAVRNAVYESASTGRRLSRWQAPTISPNEGILSSLTTIRDRSRSASRNNGHAKGAIDKLVTNIIGTGIVPLSKATDADMRTRIGQTFLAWTDESDADGLLDFYGQQAQATRAWLEAGEVFIRLRPRYLTDGLTVPLQIQVLEPELCPHTHDRVLENGNRVRAGIEFNRIGKRVAYYFHPQRPGYPEDFNPFELRRVPAESVIHLYEPLRPGQLRGLPRLTQALVALYELDKMNDAVVVRQMLANMFVGFLTKDPETVQDDTPEENPLSGEELADDGEAAPLIELIPGMFQELQAGEDVKWSTPPDAGSNYPSFMQLQLGAVSVATGVPYEVLTGDLSKVNDRTVRVILQEFRRAITASQHHILAFQFCRRVWSSWFFQAYLSGSLALPDDYLDTPRAYDLVEWAPHKWEYINPLQDVQAAKIKIRAGLGSRTGVIADAGGDAEAIDAEQYADNTRAAEFGLVHDTNAKHTSGAGVTQARPDGSIIVEPEEE